MTEERICPTCGEALPDDVPMGLCPRCLIQSGFISESDSQGGSGEPFAPPTIDELRDHFPQLAVLNLIGRGGMGAVYRARQPRLNRFVALKILSRGSDSDARFNERFEREAQALARMNHPNIVTIYDFGEAGGYFYLLMEFVDGLNLRELLRSRKIAPEEALAIVPPICDALQYAHKQGIVHRDIKPENILLDTDGRVKIADFGIAKILGTGSPEPLTREQQTVGTPHYMAPEQVEKPTTVDHRADIYSLGVVFYEMLTGELPIGRFAAPSKKVEIDVRLDEVVLRALEKEPELRFQHVSEIKTEVDKIATTPPPGTEDEPASQSAAASAVPDSKTHVNKWTQVVIYLVFFFLVGLSYNESYRRLGTMGALLLFPAFLVLIVLVRKHALNEVSYYYRILQRFKKQHISPEQENAAVPLPPLPPSPAEAKLFADAREQVRAPAIGLMITGAISIVPFALAYIRVVSSRGTVDIPAAHEVLHALALLGGLLVIAGARFMMALSAHSFCVFVAFLAMVTPPGMMLGLPLGIWALYVLNRHEVRNAFAANWKAILQGRTGAAAMAGQGGTNDGLWSRLGNYVNRFDRSLVPRRIWVVVAILSIEGMANVVSFIKHIAGGQESQILQAWIVLGWISAKLMMISGLLFRWRPVFVFNLIVTALHVFSFISVAPIGVAINLLLFILVATAHAYYFQNNPVRTPWQIWVALALHLIVIKGSHLAAIGPPIQILLIGWAVAPYLMRPVAAGTSIEAGQKGKSKHASWQIFYGVMISALFTLPVLMKMGGEVWKEVSPRRSQSQEENLERLKQLAQQRDNIMRAAGMEPLNTPQPHPQVHYRVMVLPRDILSRIIPNERRSLATTKSTVSKNAKGVYTAEISTDELEYLLTEKAEILADDVIEVPSWPAHAHSLPFSMQSGTGGMNGTIGIRERNDAVEMQARYQLAFVSPNFNISTSCFYEGPAPTENDARVFLLELPHNNSDAPLLSEMDLVIVLGVQTVRSGSAGGIKILVLDSRGRPAPDVRVYLMPPFKGLPSRAFNFNKANQQRGLTFADGSYEFHGLPPGTYQLSARAGGMGAAKPREIEVSKNRRTETTLRLEQTSGTIVSVVTSSVDGKPIPDAWLYLADSAGMLEYKEERDENGVLTIPEIPRGTYHAQVSAKGYSINERTVEVNEGETTQVTDTLHPAGSLRWVIKDQRDNPVRAIAIWLKSDDAESTAMQRVGVTNDQGAVTLRGLAPGNYVASAQVDGTTSVTQIFTVRANAHDERSVQISDSQVPKIPHPAELSETSDVSLPPDAEEHISSPTLSNDGKLKLLSFKTYHLQGRDWMALARVENQTTESLQAGIEVDANLNRPFGGASHRAEIFSVQPGASEFQRAFQLPSANAPTEVHFKFAAVDQVGLYYQNRIGFLPHTADVFFDRKKVMSAPVRENP